MKRLLLLLAAAFLVAAVMSAATITCTENQNIITNKSPNPFPTALVTNVTCPTVALSPAAGNYFTSIAITLVGSFNDAVAGDSHGLTFNVTGPFGSSIVNANTTVGPIVGSVIVTGATQYISEAGIPVGNVAVSTTLQASTTIPDNASISVYLDLTEAPIVPEPATMAVMGGGLVVLGILARRRKKA